MGKFERLKLEYGTSEMPGRRGYMEDAMCVETWCEKGEVGSNADAKSQQFALLAVCDGHGDNGVVSKFIASNVSSVVRECISKIENSSEADITRTDYWSGIWHAACLQLDLKLKQEEMITGGSTAVIALITEHEIVVANVGDSRCILIPSRDGLRKSTVVTALSEDHKPSLPNERARIVNAGFQMKTIHKVVMNENNQLAVSRSFGDFDYKANDQLQASDQSVISIAEVRVHQRDSSKDLFLFLACDGIWDVMKNHEVMDFVQQQIEIKAETSFNTILPDVADVLLQECLRRESRDNMSCILINLQPRPNTTTMSSHSSMAPKALHF
ncbi:protein serine/threonine phosphatase 2C [Fragilariopsis cylindrus CCMP1102]|uniref:Protein serine/threonine phosphatase 2C n=1 Tax=Fragilariopsis cylindrus CCMP1102 TaxID=635003 RepID=A0A1E7FEM3_9STRA|nr:protein serine/threonine phosphatase 2C [Fragilariopsis cylindrus CCMP1102]|eukprot:OEU16586.1 protein serine/threonine phosphatase 2C [Fragilariopsis cylindrus CCMP1102]